MKPSLFSLIVAATLTSAAPLPAAKEGTPAEFERVRTLYQQGKHAEAIAALEAYRKAMSPEARLIQWSIDFRGPPVSVVLIGSRYLYFTSTCSRREKPFPPALPDARPLLDDKTGVYDFHRVITCVDATNGKALWTRQTPGHCDVALDPRNDSLYVWREKLFRLKPADGEIELEKDLPRRPDRVEALLIDGRPHVPRPRHPLPQDEQERTFRTYNVDTGEVAKSDALLPRRLAPDEGRVLNLSLSYANGVHTVIEAKPLKELVKPWKYEHADYSYNEPFWLGDNVVAMNGTPTGKAEVVLLGGADGGVKWRFGLPRGAYGPGHDQLPDNDYPPRTWSAVGLSGERLLATGGEGTLYFLDPANGKLLARATPSTTYLAFPRVVKDTLIVAGIPGIRAFSMGVLLDRKRHSERDVVLLQAQCLAALGRPKEAATALGELLELDPDFIEGWALRAELCKQANLPLDEIAARCRHLELTGRETSPELRERWGLLKRVATRNDITMDLKRIGDTVYAGTGSGWLYGIDVYSLEVVQQKEFPAAFGAMVASERLKSYFVDRQWRDLAEFAEDAPRPPVKGPAGWDRVAGTDGRVVRWQGKHYRPLAGGAVRVLDGDTVREFPTRLGGIHQWQIDVSPAGPIGYGTGGVYELDENLCPVRALIDNRRREVHHAFNVYHLASDGRTLGLITDTGVEAFLQVWTRDGRKMLGEQAARAPGHLRADGSPLVPLGGGYLVSAGDVAWVAGPPGVPGWRFGFGDRPGGSLPKVHYAHANLFGRPLVCNNLLFVTCRDGGIYIFDVNTIAGLGRR